MAAAAVTALAPAPAYAQFDHWELNLHAGLIRVDLFEQSHNSPLVGARVMRHWDNGWGAGVNFDYAWEDDAVIYHNIQRTDIDMYFYTFEVDYTVPLSGPVYPFVSLGVGAATVEMDSTVHYDLTGVRRTGERDFLDETQTHFLLEPGLGLKIMNSRTDPWLAFRIDVEDKIVFDFPRRFQVGVGETHEKINRGREANNWAVSAGVSFLFGGPRAYVPPPVIPPPVVYEEPEPEIICVGIDDQWWYTSDATITVNGRNWVKFGSARAFSRDELIRIGEVDGVPVYIRQDAEVPYQEISLPLCEPEGFFQPYVPEPEVRGTTG
jgi:hypothetical protein